MKLTNFLDRIKLQNPNLGTQGITDLVLTVMLNQAVDQTNILAQVYKTFTDFNIEANKALYELSTIAPLFLGTDKRRTRFKNSDDEWTDLIPKTEKWISEQYPDYLDAGSVDIPDYYCTEGNELRLYPPPKTAYTNGGRLFHLRKSVEMLNNDHYPWTGSSVEITAFIPLDDAILAYVRWKLSPQFGNVSDVDLRYREFVSECAKGAEKIKTRRDLTSDIDYGLKTQ
jgi:hypothetical protein